MIYCCLFVAAGRGRSTHRSNKKKEFKMKFKRIKFWKSYSAALFVGDSNKRARKWVPRERFTQSTDDFAMFAKNDVTFTKRKFQKTKNKKRRRRSRGRPPERRAFVYLLVFFSTFALVPPVAFLLLNLSYKTRNIKFRWTTYFLGRLFFFWIFETV